MAIFVIGDLHLSLGADKPMDVFPGWEGYLPKLERNWRALIAPEDTVVLAGDTSWAMKLEDTRADFAFLQSLPGRKWLLKGNHDYWWTTARKMESYLAAEGFDSLHILHNNCCRVGDTALCGTRGWPFDDAAAQSAKIMAREAGRLKMSLEGRQRCGADHRVSALSARVRQYGCRGADRPAQSLRRPALLLRPSARQGDPLRGAGRARRRSVQAHLGRRTGVLPVQIGDVGGKSASFGKNFCKDTGILAPYML